ncbi:MAG: amino acid adenylation domain-containing protein [Pseudomonadota bacterium]
MNETMNVKTMDALLIGEGSLFVRCGDLLMAKGHRVKAVIKGSDGAARSWAAKAGVAHYDLQEALALGEHLSFDILFSVGNYTVIPDALLKRAKRMNINYHYGPLPEYSGLHVPSWAISEGAKEYGITWHRIGDVVDGGPVLKRVPVAIEPGDSALSLGLRCDEAAYRSLGTLIDELAQGTQTETPQDLGKRRYFSSQAQFPAENVIDWSDSAERIAALVRATDYGPYGSPLVWPKLAIGGEFYAVRKASVEDAAAGAQPGQVVGNADASGVRIAAGGQSLRIEGLSRLEGQGVSIVELAQAGRLPSGARLASPGDDAKAQLTAAGTAASKATAYWRKQLAGYNPYRLPYALPTGTGADAAPIVQKFDVTPQGLDFELSYAEYLVSGWCTFLARASGTADVHVAIAAPRDAVAADWRDLFCAWVPLLAQVDAAAPVAQGIKAVCGELRAARERGPIRRDFIGRDAVLAARFARGELTPDVMVSWDTSSFTGEDRPALELVIQSAGGSIAFHFNPKKIARANVARLAAQFADWCARLSASMAKPLQVVPAVSEQERAALVDGFNATRNDAALGGSVHQLFERAARQHGGKTALLCGDETLTYEQLNADANRMARLLQGKGVKRGDRVGVCLDRSADLVVALLAVLKTGAAYVPVDPTFPPDRIHRMLEGAKPALLITPHGTPGAALRAWAERCLCIDDARAADAGAGDLNETASPDDLAYVIFTSGSTGRPKGVEVTHGALGNFLASMQDKPGCTESDRLLAITTISFDIAALEIFLPLVAGATVVIAQPDETIDGDALLGLMRRHGITMMQATPATWQLLLQSGWTGEPMLQKILCGGEALPPQLADQLLGCGKEVWNMYGPTETTVWSSAWKVQPGEDIVIGAPIANTQLYVLDANLSPVPVGFPGELCIGGAGVARGYHEDPEQTAAVFVKNPFHPGVLYRTGDLACFKEPGRLSVLGRNDGQIKLRGFRIELGDIESAITSHPEVARAVVIGRNDQLVAYCLRDDTAAVAQDAQTENTAVTEWREVWDRAYETTADDPTFNISGWANSYDSQPFSKDEMRDWQKSTVDRILSYAPRRIFEVGSGSGLMLFGLAPHATAYHAIDASEQAVELTRRHLQTLPHVSCEHRPANKLPEVAAGAFDTVIVNSVAQYFPSANYLMSVLEWASRVVTDGRIFIGDVRDLSMLDVFHADIVEYQAPEGAARDELRRRVEHARHAERELVVAPEFFANLPALLPQVARVEIALRNGDYSNEMTRYRYDVTIHVGDAPKAKKSKAAAHDWSKEGMDLAALAAMLDGKAKQLAVSGIPNGRLADVHKRVSGIVDTSFAPTEWIDPRDLKRAAAEAGYEMAMLPARSRDIWAMDAVFWKAGEQPDLSWQPAKKSVTRQELLQWANVPAAGVPNKPALGRVLRPWVEERLPSYMVPAFFVELEEFPLTPNGKIDRKALPEPTEVMLEPAVLPTNELEQQILAIWAEVLGHDRIGVNDSFFRIGGNSLRVVRVQAELQKLLNRPIGTATLYEFFTIKELASHLSGAKKAAQHNPSKRRATAADDDVAIVAMNCRLPGNVNSPEDFWQLLDRGGDGIVDVPKDRWDADALYDADPDARGKSYCKKGGFVAPIDLFDAGFFGVSPREARALDPAQRMMLEVTWEAFERAGYSMDQLRGTPTGVFVGIGKGYHEYGLALAGGLSDLDGYVGTGSAGATMAGRVSYVFGLEGPSMTVDTACSSSLVTTHLACNALRRGECDMAVAGGITLMLSPDLHVEFSRLRGMSPDGRCKSFSADTDGTGWSEGAAVVVLKRLSDAQRDGDPILAILRGTAVNHAGHSASLTTPSGPAQQRVIREALSMSNLKPGDIDYLEAHGTGTRLGDPIEANGLAAVFGGSRSGDTPLFVGSVKSNLGHTQAAAGLAGVIKVVLAMHHNRLPRTLHVTEPSPSVDWKATQMELVTQEQPWQPGNRPRRAGVSSFGIGGTNAHCIVEEPPVVPQRKPAVSGAVPTTFPFVLSGFTVPALRAQADKLHVHMGMNIEDRLLDVSYALATTRTHFRKRIVMFAKSKGDLLDALASFARTGETPAGATRTPEDRADESRLAMLFTGQGSQLPGMGRDLYRTYPVFKQGLDEIVARFNELERPLLDVMWAEPGSAEAKLLNRTDFTQPALFALEVALWRLWDSWGVKPDLVLGHSIGEIAAAHVAGVFELGDACRLVAARGRLMQALPAGGGMASLEASGAEAQDAIKALNLGGRVSLAGLNTPTQTVVSGDLEAVEQVVAHFAQQGRKAKQLTVSHAFHSHLMEPMLAQFRTVAASVRYAAPRIPLVSTLTGLMAKADELGKPDYWVQQVREAVRFNTGMRTLYEQGANTFLELGPQPVLSGMGAACLADDGPVSWVPSIVPGKEEAAGIQKSLADIHVLGVQVDWRGYFEPFGAERVALPTYAFQRERYWLEPMPRREVGAGLTDANHQLLGGGVQVAGTDMTMFTTVVAADEPVWVQEHQVMDAVLMPGTAFFEAMRAAGKACLKGAWDASEVMIMAPLVLAPGVSARLQVTVGALADGARPVRVYSSPESEDGEGEWQLHAEGKLVPALEAETDSVTVPPSDGEPIDVTSLYKDLAELGYGYGPTFQGIRQAWHVDDIVWTRASLPEAATSSASRFGLHPALLDSAMHSLLLTQRIRDAVSDDVFVPFEAERLSVWKEGQSELWVRVAEFEMGDGEFWATLDLFDAQGNSAGRLDRLHARRIDRAALRKLASAGTDRYHFEVSWNHVEAPSADEPKTWGFMTQGNVGWAEDVRTRLTDAGVQILEISEPKEAEGLDGVICLWDADGSVVADAHGISSSALAQLQALGSSGFQPQVAWVTRGAIGAGGDDKVSNLGTSPLWGLMRAARTEHPELNLRIIDIGEEPADLEGLAAALSLPNEPEVAIRRGQLVAARLSKASGDAGLVVPTEGAWRLEIATKGRLDLPLSVKTLGNEALAAGEIRAEIKATGVNFLDVLNALGMVEIPGLGLEFAGVVTEAGANVKHVKVGDPVFGLARGTFGSSVVVDGRQVVRKPDNISFEEAATVPMTFLTAWYGLHDLGKIKAGERVLVHAAAGGVGMAAVQLARLQGCEVYGTASEPKWDALRKAGLADDHIGTSRSLDFVQVFEKTAPGRSFDVVLNSLAREFVDTSLGMLRPGGRFLEMGKLDLREQSWVDQHHPGVTYRVYNLPEAGVERIHQMMDTLAGLFAEGKLKPLPIRTFPMNQASDALRFIAQARHVGKVVLVPAQQRGLVNPDGAVLITGGVGGLGRTLAKWLATHHGVKDLVLTSRRGMEAPEAQEIVTELADLGVRATVAACDAADTKSLQAVMASFSAERPLRGVVHAAGVLDDGMLSGLTPERMDRVLAPKVDGGWNLHKMTQDMELDFFVLFSSISGVTGTPGQGNYAAANAFLDALAFHRRSRGLPATSIAWGAWDGAGMASKLSDADKARFSRQGMDALSPTEGTELFEAAVMKGGALSVVAAIDLGRLQRTMEEHGEPPALFRALFKGSAAARAQDTGGGGGGSNLRKVLGNTPAEQHEAVVIEMVRAEVAKALEFSSPEDVDVGLPLQDIGIDSLTAVLLRNQLSDMTGLALPAKIAFDHPNLRSLGQFLFGKVSEAGLIAPAPSEDAVVAKDAAPKRAEDKGVRKGQLAAELKFDNAPRKLARPEAVFVTGATGFVGAYLAAELLKSGIAVHGLVRADDAEQGRARLVEALSGYGLWNADYAKLVTPVVGDLTQPMFGLPEAEFDTLADQVDAICHSGALVDWMLPLDNYIGPNVVGTHEALRLASRGKGKVFHLISTAATLPKYHGYDIPKDDREFGYGTSKYMAEQMVVAARWRGAVASIYRLPFVGASSAGQFRRDAGDFLHNLIAGCVELGAFPSADAGLSGVLPVDYLGKSIAQVMTRDFDRIGRDWDFFDGKAPSFNGFVEVLRAAGAAVQTVGFMEWRSKAMQHAAANPKGALARIAAVVDDMTQKDFELMFEGFPVGRDVFGGEAYPAPAVDANAVQPYLERIASAGEQSESRVAETA